MNRIAPLATVLLGCLFLFSCNTQQADDQSEQAGNQAKAPVVMAYYVPEKDYQPERVPVEQLTHIIFSFTHVIDGEMKFRHPETAGLQLKQLVEQKARNPKLKVMIACGGWGADGFSDMCSTPEGIEKFAASVYQFVQEYQLDGMDVDWEYPTIPAAGTGARDADKENFTTLMMRLRAVLDSTNRPQTLTFASAGWQPYYDNIETEKVMQYADYMNIMTYDQVSGVSVYTGHHTPLGNIPFASVANTPFGQHLDSLRKAENAQDPGPHSVEKIVDYLLAKGVAPEQLVIGAAFYGRAWKVGPENNGLYQMSKGIHIGWSQYAHIRDNFEPDPNYVRYWDEQAKAPYLYNAAEQIMISYDDTVSVRLKTLYAMEKGLGGIMFWQLGDDTKKEGSLLDAIDQAAKAGSM